MSEFAPPVVFTSPPTLEQLIEFENRSLAIERIESNTVTISSPEMGGQKISGDIQWERPYNFAIRAYFGSRAFGTALAAGSNQEEFWLQQSSPPTLYFARHDAFDAQPGPRHILPVSPLWFREAMGIVEFSPSWQHDGPHLRTDGKLEVQSWIPSARGSYRRVLAFDPKTGAVSETTLYDPDGRMVARALQSQHEYYSAIGYSLPHKVIVQLQSDDLPGQGPSIENLSFTMEIGFYSINQPSNARSSPFIKPDATGMTQVDLVSLNASGPAAAPIPPVYRSTQLHPPSPTLGTRTPIMR